MRGVALLVVVCGCGVAASSPQDAGALGGDGLPDRVITDGALWRDLSSGDQFADAGRSADSANPSDGVGDRATTMDVLPADSAPEVPGTGGGDSACGLLLASSCVGDERCYPFSFEGPFPGDTRCAFQGVGGPSVPCQSQLECDGTTVCAAPGQPDSTCLQRCNLENPRCPTGFTCEPYFAYAGVGACR